MGLVLFERSGIQAVSVLIHPADNTYRDSNSVIVPGVGTYGVNVPSQLDDPVGENKEVMPDPEGSSFAVKFVHDCNVDVWIREG